jgi:CheY-like chemotaxis protein
VWWIFYLVGICMAIAIQIYEDCYLGACFAIGDMYNFIKTDPRCALDRSKLRVLIVDDHLSWRKTLKLYLASLPQLEVLDAVSDGYAALAICKNIRPDLVLLDINMPGMDGFETARALRVHYPDLWIIGLSVEVNDESHIQAQQAGFKSVISKDKLLDFLSPSILLNHLS